MKRRLPALLALLLSLAAFGCGGAPAAMNVATTTVKSGSMARFIVRDGFLYALDQQTLIVYDLGNGPDAAPQKVNVLDVQWDAETLFPYGQLLFVGSRQGMLVYDLEDQALPKLIGQASHFVSCDPVVVENDIAYVTLRGGAGPCMRGTNALLVFNVENPTAPELLAQHEMQSPLGIAVDDARLFIADATSGLLVLDLRNPRSPVLLAQAPTVKGYDLIAHAGTLFVSADDGLYQYHYGPDVPLAPQPISRIPIGKPKLQVATEPGTQP